MKTEVIMRVVPSLLIYKVSRKYELNLFPGNISIAHSKIKIEEK